ncbi:substrate-binding domain-containing protein [Microbacterium sp. HMH0099]|uniref:substrate-binding domain-containing protein n=1 Tax=Microbacterium sp. HMH0099 TaxID=3414026 RepID=UPI003BF6586F
MTVLAGRAAGEALRDRDDRSDVVFAASDLLAVGVLQALTMLGGILVPDDIPLVGYDDIDFAAATVVPPTSVRSRYSRRGGLLEDAESDTATERHWCRRHRTSSMPPNVKMHPARTFCESV